MIALVLSTSLAPAWLTLLALPFVLAPQSLSDSARAALARLGAADRRLVALAVALVCVGVLRVAAVLLAPTLVCEWAWWLAWECWFL